jgi:hypothetical protein
MIGHSRGAFEKNEEAINALTKKRDDLISEAHEEDKKDEGFKKMVVILQSLGHLDSTFESRDLHPLSLKSLSKEEALTLYKNTEVRAGPWKYVSKHLAQEMPYITPEGKNIKVVIMKFNEDIFPDEVVQEMDKLGVCPLTYEEFIQFVSANPDYQKQNTLIAAGSKHKFDDHLYYVPSASVSYFSGERHELGLCNWGGKWPSHYRFPVVAK